MIGANATQQIPSIVLSCTEEEDDARNEYLQNNAFYKWKPDNKNYNKLRSFDKFASAEIKQSKYITKLHKEHPIIKER